MLTFEHFRNRATTEPYGDWTVSLVEPQSVTDTSETGGTICSGSGTGVYSDGSTRTV